MKINERFLGAILFVALGGAIACSSASAPTASAPTAPAAPTSASVPQTSPAPASASTAQASPAQQPSSPSGGLQVFEILEQGLAYQPSRVTVRAGAPVRFVIRNDDAEQHNLISAQLQIPQNQQEPGKVSTVDWVAPTQPGTYEVACAFHSPDMKMSIIVQ